ncbi:MAG: molybdopterin-binding protein [Verrucomicrobiota bacterium]
MNVELINTGSELMLGRVLNTHQQWLCRRLADLGYIVTRQVAVADTAQAIEQAVREALSRAELVITTGGLGPTSDDITRDLIAQLLGKKLREDASIVQHIERFFAARKRPMPASTARAGASSRGRDRVAQSQRHRARPGDGSHARPISLVSQPAALNFPKVAHHAPRPTA